MTTNPRFDLAAARVALRAAEDTEKTMKAILTMNAAGTNDTQRKGHAAQLLINSDDYQDAFTELRAAEAAVDHAVAAVGVYEDDLRRAELAARERLADALQGKRADDAAADRTRSTYYDQYLKMPEACMCDTCRAERAENSAKGFSIP